MVSTTYFDHAKSLLDTHQLDMTQIDEAVRNILRLKFQLGLFDAKPSQPPAEILDPAGLEIAKRLATESAVLLKNAGDVLPISKSIGKLAVIGPLADSPLDQMGTWVMDGRNSDVQTPLAALRQRLGASRILYAPALKNSRDNTHDGFAEAIRQARAADAVVLFLGEEQILSGEAHSRAFLDLPGAQEALVNELAQTGKPLIAVIMAGRPLTFHGAAAHLNAILYAWHPGTMGGPAIADLLLGDAVPSGKLTMTFPRTVGQVPVYYAHLNTGRPASPSELGVPLGNPVNPVGYTSKYVDVDFTPEYPFGFGLSYTRFAYSGLQLSQTKFAKGGSVNVSAQVMNQGSREADEVVQLYTQQLVGSVSRPVRELRAFRRIHLKPGEKATVSFPLRYQDLAFYNLRNQFVTEPGKFNVWIAPDSSSGVQGAFSVE